ncbi:MAG: hypothetical protein H7222_05120 [Methylotenera sp.]|nr:hypothetical protein [Oligoflexia bacterium]
MKATSVVASAFLITASATFATENAQCLGSHPGSPVERLVSDTCEATSPEEPGLPEPLASFLEVRNGREDWSPADEANTVKAWNAYHAKNPDRSTRHCTLAIGKKVASSYATDQHEADVQKLLSDKSTFYVRYRSSEKAQGEWRNPDRSRSFDINDLAGYEKATDASIAHKDLKKLKITVFHSDPAYLERAMKIRDHFKEKWQLGDDQVQLILDPNEKDPYNTRLDGPTIPIYRSYSYHPLTVQCAAKVADEVQDAPVELIADAPVADAP